MKSISAENVFIVNIWMKQQTGKKLEDLPPITKLDDGRYKCELNIPTLDTLIACTGNSKIEAIDHLFTRAVKEIKKYCLEKGLEVPFTPIRDKMVITEENGELVWDLNPKYSRNNGKTKLKCPICGGTTFIKGDLPVRGSPDAHLEFEDTYGCVKCGYMVSFNKYIPHLYREKLAEIAAIDEQISKLNDKLEFTLTKINDLSQHKKDLQKYKKELKQRQEWGEDNKNTRALIESIEYEESYIKGGKNLDAERSIKQMRYDIEQLEKQRSEINEVIKPF